MTNSKNVRCYRRLCSTLVAKLARNLLQLAAAGRLRQASLSCVRASPRHIPSYMLLINEDGV